MEGTEVISVQTADGSEVQITAAQLDHTNSLVHQQAQVLNQAMIQGSLIAPIVSTSHQNTIISSPRLEYCEHGKGSEVLEYLKKAKCHEKYSDVVLYVQGRSFNAHKLVLSATSPYFDSVFQSQTPTDRRSRMSNFRRGNGKVTLSVACSDPEVFQVLLNYMYTGQITIDRENVGELLRMSNNFLLTKLKSYCGDYLEKLMNSENCLHIRDLGNKYNLPDLVKTATLFVQSNLVDVINSDVIMELPAKQVESFVTDKAWNISDEDAVKFMSRWVCSDISNRERDFKQLLTNVDWNIIESNAIVDYIDQEPLYGSSERCFYYVLHSLAEKGIQVQKYDQMYQALQQRFGQEPDQPLGFGDNLLQMAFNSAMEGLQVPTDSTTLLIPNGRGENKWSNENDGIGKSKPKRKEALCIDSKRRRILQKTQRNRAVKKWVVVRCDRPRRHKLIPNEALADSSGDEECDPIQTPQGYRCHLCPFVTKKVSRLERHLSSLHGHDVTYRCCECGFTCKWNREYFLHMKSHYDGPPYKCQACEFTCQKIGSLIAHKVTHVDLQPYQCAECDYKCRNKANLAVHLKSHNNEKPYRCKSKPKSKSSTAFGAASTGRAPGNICGRNFASKNSLDQHSVGHNTDKTYTCAQCPFNTKYLNHYTNHKKTHHTVVTGTKKGKGELYRCQDTGCKYTTSKKSQLDSHMRSHAGVRPHVCSICGRRFLEKSHLVRHERIHYNERPFKCEECDYASTRRDKLKEHKTRHHGANASAKSPYKPRPHKNSKQSFVGDQTLVYAKKSSAHHQNAQITQVVSGDEQSVTAVATASGELEFIIPHSHIANVTGADGGTTYAQLAQASTIDLQQMANSAGIVQLRSFSSGKPTEIQVAHTLASIPTTMSAQDLQRTLGVKLEDLHGQSIIGIQQGGTARTIKIEELTGNVQVTGGAGGVAQGLGTGTRNHHGTTMVLDAAQLQQLAAAAVAAGLDRTIPITIASIAAPNRNSNNIQSTVSLLTSQGSNSSSEFSALTGLLY